MSVFDERIRGPGLNFDGRFCAVTLSLFGVASHQKERPWCLGAGANCNLSFPAPPRTKSSARKNSLKPQKVDLKNKWWRGRGEVGEKYQSPPLMWLRLVVDLDVSFLLFPSLTRENAGILSASPAPPNIGNISVGVVVVTSQRAPSSSPFLCKIQIIPPHHPSPIAAVRGFLSRSLTLRKEQ